MQINQQLMLIRKAHRLLSWPSTGAKQAETTKAEAEWAICLSPGWSNYLKTFSNRLRLRLEKRAADLPQAKTILPTYHLRERMSMLALHQ
jgi:hypothetical protein